MVVEKQKIINRHLLAKVLKNCHISETEVDKAKLSNARIIVVNIPNRVPNTYNTNEKWVVLPIFGNM